MAKLPRIYRAFRFIRFVKATKAMRFSKWVSDFMENMNMNVSLSRALKFLLALTFLVHLTSCAWYFVASMDDFSHDTWIMRGNYQDRSDTDNYLSSVYFTLTVLDTIGYGDIVPKTVNERILCIFWITFGISFYSYTISNLTLIFSNIKSRENFIEQKEDTLREFAKFFKLPKPLVKQVKYCVRFNYRNNVFSWSDMDSFLKELPSKLYNKVYKHIFRDVLECIAFFRYRPPDFISELMPLMKNVVVHEGYELYSHGAIARDVFFLMKGRIIVKDKHDAVLLTYVKGSYFGDIEVVMKTDRKHTTQVEETAHLLKIDAHEFMSVVEKFPEIKEEISELAKERYESLKQTKKKFKQAKIKLDKLQKHATVNLLKLNPLLDDIMSMKLEGEEAPSSHNLNYLQVPHSNQHSFIRHQSPHISHLSHLNEDETYESLCMKIMVKMENIRKYTSQTIELYDRVVKLSDK